MTISQSLHHLESDFGQEDKTTRLLYRGLYKADALKNHHKYGAEANGVDIDSIGPPFLPPLMPAAELRLDLDPNEVDIVAATQIMGVLQDYSSDKNDSSIHNNSEWH